MRDKFASSAAAILVGALFVAGEVAANPDGVPLPGGESPPLSCTTSNFVVTLASTAATTCGTSKCTEYTYTVNSKTLNVDHTVIAISATQDLDNSGTSNPKSVGDLGVGDNVTGFLAGAVHEYAVRFQTSNNKSVTWKVSILGASSPRIGTVLIRSGSKILEKCLVATPGIASDTFQPAFQSQTVVLAGGKCIATLVFDASGNVFDITNLTPTGPGITCFPNDVDFTQPPRNGVVSVNGAPLKNNSGPHGITFGNGTTTCYGPPKPSIPKCVCTATPCP